METARKRILHFIESQDIKPNIFLEKTGLKKGFLDKSHENSGASDVFLSKVLEGFPELSAEWLVTGNGEMFKKSVSVKKFSGGSEEGENCKACIEKDKIIQLQETIITTQNKTIESQEEALSFYRRRATDRPNKKAS